MSDLSADYALLGVEPSVDDAALIAARRRVALRLHPDRGGSDHAMAQLNEAFDNIMRARAVIVEESEPRTTPTSIAQDAPSFTINVLPVEAFEYLLIAAQELGEVADSDPPYVLEVMMRRDEGDDQWCRLEVVPDAGSSTVSLICEVVGDRGVEAESCRDRWVKAVNDIDVLPGH